MISDEAAIKLHLILADYHADMAKAAMLDIVHDFHAELSERLAQEAALMAEHRRNILEARTPEVRDA